MTTLALLLALAAGGPSPEQAVQDVLKNRRYEFCHEPRFPLTEDEVRWCDQLRPGPTPCPAFAEACKRGAAAHLVGRRDRFTLSLPELALPVRLLLAAGVALVVGLIVWAVLRGAAAWRRRLPGDEEHPQPRAAGATVGGTSPEVERDVARLLALARAAAAAGDHAAAIAHLHAALLRRLEGRGVLVVHPSRTNGEYLREVRRREPGLAPDVGAFVGAVEAAQFGGAPPSAATVEDLFARVGRLGAVAALLVVLLGGGCRPDRGGWDTSPSGRAAVVEVLRRTSLDARERFVPLAKLGDGGPDALVLLPGANVAAEEWAALEAWVGEGGLLVVAGVPADAPPWLRARAAPDVASRGPRVVAVHETLPEVSVPAGERLELQGADWTRLLQRAQDSIYAARREVEEGALVVLADARLFTNAALVFPGNAAAARALLADGRVELVGELTGLVSPNPVASVRRGRLLPFLVQFGLLAALLFLWKGAAFGRLREPAAVTRREFVEHVEALGQQYARGRASRHVLGAFGAWATERLRERVRPSQGGLIALAEGIAARTGRPAGEVARVLVEARADGGPPPSGIARRDRREETHAQLRLMRELWDILQATDERRRSSG